MSWGTTDTSTTVLGANQFPVSAVAEPGRTNLTALEGGPGSVDVNSNRTAPMSAYIKDGGDVTQGTSTDANTVASVMGRLTKIRDLLNATLTVAVSGSVTEANSASIKADLDAINTAIGAISDAAWSGSGNGSEIAILKKIVAELAGTIAVSGTFWQATQPVSGTVTANAGTGTFNNQQSNNTTDYDSGAGTQTMTMFGMALPASGGAVAGGTSSNPVRIDPTGTTTQPISGTITANAGANLNTSLLALESGGNLATLAGAITGAKAQANVAQINGVAPSMGNGVSGTGVQRVTIASDSTGQVALAAGANTIGAVTQASGPWTNNVSQLNGTTTDTNSGNKSAGTLRVVIATDQPSLTNALSVAQSGTWTAVPNAATSGGSTPSHTMSAASTNATSLKASAGQVYGYAISNANAAARYVKFYDKASAPTVGTDTPKHTIQIPANGTVIRAIPEGMVFTLGIAWAATGVITDADATAIGLNDLSIDIDYK